MSRRTGVLAAALATLALLGAASAAPASAAPKWDLRVNWSPTNLAPGQVGQFAILPFNYGPDASSGPYTVSMTLPPGVTRVPPSFFDSQANPDIEGEGWICSGTITVSCTRSEIVPAYRQLNEFNEPFKGAARRAFFRVQVDPAAPEATYDQEFQVSGNGASTTVTKPLTVSSTPTGYGVERGSFDVDPFDDEYPGDGKERQANGHPFELRVNFDFTLEARQAAPLQAGLSTRLYTVPVEEPRTVRSTLPRGLIGNPEATPKCSLKDFLAQQPGLIAITSGCPPETQIGTVNLDLGDGDVDNKGYGPLTVEPNALRWIPVYNLEPKDGVPADFGFTAGEYRAHIYPNLDASNDYAIMAVAPYVSSFLKAHGASLSMWGVPADPAHDYQRYDPGTKMYGASFNAPIHPLLTLTGECGTEHSGLISTESWQHPGNWTGSLEAKTRFASTGCDDPRIRFNPQIALTPTSTAASGPTGLSVNLINPQRSDLVEHASQLYPQNGDVRAIATPPIKKATVTLPEGMTLSASAAQGLSTCSSAQIRIGTNDPVTCPTSSQYGILTVATPILPDPVKGRLYIARQNDNPFNGFFALYLVIEDPKTGILLKIPAKATLDHRTGRISTSFDNLPPFPVSSMTLSFKGGVRAALVNPTTCGRKVIRAELYSWSNPNTPVPANNFYDITRKADGSPCVNNLAERPFRPQLDAGTVNPSAGASSPFFFRLTRTDDDQEFSQIGVTLPGGLTAKLAGVSQCSDAAIRQAEGRTGAGDGTLEMLNPSCPASSYIGTTEVGTGVGVPLTYVPGKVYLAGPYHGAPLSMVVISPAVVGPYDLGVIAVRTSLDIDPVSAQAKAVSDPFPQIFQGIPVRIRDIRMHLDRPSFTRNPTNCSEKQIDAHVTGTGGDLVSTADDTGADLVNRFQAANCASLGFKPKLGMRLFGGVRRGAHPSLRATLRMPAGGSNISRVSVALPRSAFLDQAHIRTVCTRVQFAAKSCPARSIYGRVEATTPLIDGKLSGPVYLRSSSNPLPDLVATLRGPADMPIEVHVVGRIDSINGGIRSTFDVVPDQPVSSFTLRMQGGKKGLLQNSTNLCKRAHRATAKFRAQNGKARTLRPALVSSCKKVRKHRRHSGHRRQG